MTPLGASCSRSSTYTPCGRWAFGSIPAKMFGKERNMGPDGDSRSCPVPAGWSHRRQCSLQGLHLGVVTFVELSKTEGAEAIMTDL
ncbi:hypothetical protein AAMO2058_001602400 [Amorphochlora amoebiformis]